MITPSVEYDLTARDGAERPDQLGRAGAAYLGDDLCFGRVRQPCQAKQDDPGVRETLPEDKIAEVPVRCQQNRVPRVGLAQDLVVSNARRQLGHVDDVMAVLAEALHHRAVDTLIGDQIHADLALTG